MKDEAILYYYFADGAYQDGSHFILTNLQLKLLKHLGETKLKIKENMRRTHFFHCLDANNIKSPKTNDKFQYGDDTFLEDAIAAISVPIIIVVDGLEKVIRGEGPYLRKYVEILVG